MQGHEISDDDLKKYVEKMFALHDKDKSGFLSPQ